MRLGFDRRAEDHEHAVAHELDQRSVKPLDLLIHLAEIVVEHADQVLRLHPFGYGREPTQIAHQDREPLPVSAESPALGRIQDLTHNIIGQIAAEGLLKHAVAQLKLLVEAADGFRGADRVAQLRQFGDIADDEHHADRRLPVPQIGGHDPQVLEALSPLIDRIALLSLSFSVDGVEHALNERVVPFIREKNPRKG